MQNRIKALPCEECKGTTVVYQKEGTTIVTWCACRENNPRLRNQLLQSLRKEGWDVGPELFAKTAKEAHVGLLCRKFRDQAALEKGWVNLCKVAGVSKWEAEAIVRACGSLEAGYMRLQTNWAKQRKAVRG